MRTKWEPGQAEAFLKANDRDTWTNEETRDQIVCKDWLGSEKIKSWDSESYREWKDGASIDEVLSNASARRNRSRAQKLLVAAYGDKDTKKFLKVAEGSTTLVMEGSSLVIPGVGSVAARLGTRMFVGPSVAFTQTAAGPGAGKASEIIKWAERKGWTKTQTANGPMKFVDENGVVRVTIKRGSPRAPGSGAPHVELRSPSGQRINPSGKPVTRSSPDNHAPIEWDLK